MTGLDKIVNQILDDAGKEASQVMEKAHAEAILSRESEKTWSAVRELIRDDASCLLYTSPSPRD